MATVTPPPKPAAPARVSVSDYLDMEWAAENSGGRKREYVRGEVREVTGASREHNVVAWNLLAALGFRLRGKPFEAYPGDMRVRGGEAGPYYYPDVVVAPSPGRIEKDRGSTLLNPVVIAEILSPSTEAVDRGEKLANYGRIESLSDYLLVSQDGVRVDHYVRQPDGSWRVVILEDLAAAVPLTSVGVELPLAEVYDRLFPAAPAPAT